MKHLKEMRIRPFKGYHREINKVNSPGIPKTIYFILWSMFLGNLAYLLFLLPHIPEWKVGNLLKGDAFTLLKGLHTEAQAVVIDYLIPGGRSGQSGANMSRVTWPCS